MDGRTWGLVSKNRDPAVPFMNFYFQEKFVGRKLTIRHTGFVCREETSGMTVALMFFTFIAA